jgi:hypothetical protein
MAVPLIGDPDARLTGVYRRRVTHEPRLVINDGHPSQFERAEAVTRRFWKRIWHDPRARMRVIGILRAIAAHDPVKTSS